MTVLTAGLVLAATSATALRVAHPANGTTPAAKVTTPPATPQMHFRTIAEAYDFPTEYIGAHWKNCDRNTSVSQDVDMTPLRALAPALVPAPPAKRIKVVLLGDSVMGVMKAAVNFMAGGEGDDCAPRPAPCAFNILLSMVPHDPDHLLAMLRKLAGEFDVLVFSIGLWYNWFWERPLTLLDGWHDPSYTTKLVQASCPNLTTRSNETLFDNEVQRAYAHGRKALCHTNDLDAYVSDLARLQKGAAQVRREYPNVRFIWKSVSPQFFRRSINWDGEALDCRPVENRTKARLRNLVAEQVLALGDTFELLDTFDQELPLWDLHAGNDCTHFCNPSAGTWSQAVSLFKFLAKGTRPAQSE